MGCSENCKCRPMVIGFVFMPGIMGSRLKNKATGERAWDPGTQLSFEGLSGEGEQAKQDRQAEINAAQADEDDELVDSIGKWFQRRWTNAKQALDYVKEIGRSVRRRIKMIPTLTDYIFAGPAKRKRMLVNANKGAAYKRDNELVDVDEGTDDYFKVFTTVPPSKIEYRRKSGWGEMLWDSYGPFLNHLEKEFNNLREYPKIKFQAFAVGYNWMQGNDIAGERIKKKLAEFKALILENNPNGVSEQDIKFILVSHSMGGLASRAASVLSQVEVEAALLGAMPTHGSPDTYKRFRTGHPGGAKLVIGKNAADITAILGFSQGGLQLLPNHIYRNSAGEEEWLFYNTDKDQDKSKNKKLPIEYGNKIFDFYKRFDRWYQMVMPELLAPELTATQFTEQERKQYILGFFNEIAASQKFNKDLAHDFHPDTILIYSVSEGKKHKSYDCCVWQSDGQPEGDVEQWAIHATENHALFFGDGTTWVAASEKTSSPVDNGIRGRNAPLAKTVAFTIGPATSGGDSVVQLGCGKHATPSPEKPKRVPVENFEEDHQGFYNCPNVRKKAVEELKAWVKDIHDKMGAG